MAEPLCDLSGGEIRAAPLASILIEALRLRATGELRIDASGGTSRIYLRGGQPCGAQVFFGFKPLGQFLLELGWIDIEALERSLAAVVDGRKQGETLVQLGYITRDQLQVGLALHHQRHVRVLSELGEGTYSFRATAELPSWTDELRLSAHRAIVDALAAPPGRPVAQRLLRRVPAGLGLRLRSGWDRFAGHFQLDAAEQMFVAGLDRPTAIDAALRAGHLPEERAQALLAAFKLMAILVPAPLGGEAPWATPGPAVVATPGPVDTPPIPARPAQQPVPSTAVSPGPPPAARPLSPGPFGALRSNQAVAAGEAFERTIVLEELAEPEAPAPAAPAPASRSDEAAGRERRARMLQRAFESIPGAGAIVRQAAGPAAPQRWDELPAAGDPAFERHVRARLASVGDEDHFARLGLPRTAGREDIKQAFFAAAKRLHPDRIPAAVQHLAPQLKELFAAINDSYQLLQDDERRLAYLAELDHPEVHGDDRAAKDAQVRTLESRAAAAAMRRDYAAVQQILGEALQVDDRPDLRAHILWARQSEKPHEAGLVRTELEQLAARFPRCAAAHYYLGVLARVSGDTARARDSFRRTLDLVPDHREARQELRLIDLRQANNPQQRKH